MVILKHWEIESDIFLYNIISNKSYALIDTVLVLYFLVFTLTISYSAFKVILNLILSWFIVKRVLSIISPYPLKKFFSNSLKSLLSLKAYSTLKVSIPAPKKVRTIFFPPYKSSLFWTYEISLSTE